MERERGCSKKRWKNSTVKQNGLRIGQCDEEALKNVTRIRTGSLNLLGKGLDRLFVPCLETQPDEVRTGNDLYELEKGFHLLNQQREAQHA